MFYSWKCIQEDSEDIDLLSYDTFSLRELHYSIQIDYRFIYTRLLRGKHDTGLLEKNGFFFVVESENQEIGRSAEPESEVHFLQFCAKYVGKVHLGLSWAETGQKL